MGVSKVEKFSRRLNRIASCGHALGHPARVAILELLLRRKRLIALDISGHLPLAPATVAQHLRVMTSAGLLRLQINGSSAFYEVEKKVLDGMLEDFQVWQSAKKH